MAQSMTKAREIKKYNLAGTNGSWAETGITEVELKEYVFIFVGDCIEEERLGGTVMLPTSYFLSKNPGATYDPQTSTRPWAFNGAEQRRDIMYQNGKLLYKTIGVGTWGTIIYLIS